MQTLCCCSQLNNDSRMQSSDHSTLARICPRDQQLETMKSSPHLPDYIHQTPFLSQTKAKQKSSTTDLGKPILSWQETAFHLFPGYIYEFC